MHAHRVQILHWGHVECSMKRPAQMLLAHRKHTGYIAQRQLDHVVHIKVLSYLQQFMITGIFHYVEFGLRFYIAVELGQYRKQYRLCMQVIQRRPLKRQVVHFIEAPIVPVEILYVYVGADIVYEIEEAVGNM